MTLICYQEKDQTGWEQFDLDINLISWIQENPHKTPTHVFKSGHQYSINTIEQAQFQAQCHTYGFEARHYRTLVSKDKKIYELCGFNNSKHTCIIRNTKTMEQKELTTTETHTLFNIKDPR